MTYIATINTPGYLTHWHVATGLAGYGPDAADGYITVGRDVTPEALTDVIREELSDAASYLADSADGYADAEDYESAWHAHKRAEELDILASNLDYRRRSLAPLYVNDRPALDATMTGLVADNFPLALDHDDTRRLYVWECGETECDESDDS